MGLRQGFDRELCACLTTGDRGRERLGTSLEEGTSLEVQCYLSHTVLEYLLRVITGNGMMKGVHASNNKLTRVEKRLTIIQETQASLTRFTKDLKNKLK